MSLHRMKLYSLLRRQSSTLTQSFETLWLVSGDVHSNTLKQLHFSHEADHVICDSHETRHTVYYVTVRSRTSCSSTNENQVYLCVPTEQRRLVVKRTRKSYKCHVCLRRTPVSHCARRLPADLTQFLDNIYWMIVTFVGIDYVFKYNRFKPVAR